MAEDIKMNAFEDGNEITKLLGLDADGNGRLILPNNLFTQLLGSDIFVTKRYCIDLRDKKYDQSTYYPVTMQIGHIDLAEITCITNIDFSGHPDWATHSVGFSALIKWTVNAGGWGGNVPYRAVFVSNYCFCNIPPVKGLGQMVNSSNEYVYCRGGGKYYFTTNNNIVPVIRDSKFELNGQSVAPCDASVLDEISANFLYT